MAKKKVEYKPVMVFYIKDFDYASEEDRMNVYESLKKIKEELGYSTLVVPIEGDSRVEIISVDKATVVEDISKYLGKFIDDKEVVIPSVPKEERANLDRK